MPRFPSQEWVEELMRVTQDDPEYQKAGADWEGDMVMVIEPEPGKLDKPFIYYSRPHHGEILESQLLQSEDEKQAEFVIRAPYSVVKGIIKGEVEPMQEHR